MLSLLEALLCFVDGGIVNIWGVQVVSFGVVGGGAAAADDAPKREWCRWSDRVLPPMSSSSSLPSLSPC